MSHKQLLKFLKQHEEANSSKTPTLVEPEQNVPVQQSVEKEEAPIVEAVEEKPIIHSLADKVSKLKTAANKVKRPKKDLNKKKNNIVELW